MGDPPAGEPVRVACVGASVTFGRGLPNRREECYPAVLQRLLDDHAGAGAYRVRNFGYSGATASRGGGEPYWQTPSLLAATRFDPGLVVIVLGTNDAQFANAGGRATLGHDLTDLVDHFRTREAGRSGATVWLCQPPPVFPPVAEIDFAALAEEVRPTISRVAERLDTPLIDLLSPLSQRQGAFPDGLHPTAAVAHEIAEIVSSALIGGG